MLKKKHYDAVGEVLKANLAKYPESKAAITNVTQDLAEYFESENPMFQSDRFIAGCGVENND